MLETVQAELLPADCNNRFLDAFEITPFKLLLSPIWFFRPIRKNIILVQPPQKPPNRPFLRGFRTREGQKPASKNRKEDWKMNVMKMLLAVIRSIVVEFIDQLLRKYCVSQSRG